MTSDDRFDPARERAFVEAVLSREQVAVEEFARRMRRAPRFLALLSRRMGCPLDATELDDLDQEVALSVLRSLDRFEGRAPLEVWIFRICELTLRSWIRRSARDSKVRYGEIHESQQPSSDGSSLESLARREQVARLLNELGGTEAEILRMRHFEDLSLDDIAERRNEPAATIKTRYYRARRKLQQLFERSSRNHDGGTP